MVIAVYADARVEILKARGGRIRDATGVICITSVSLSFRRPAYSLLRLQPLLAFKPDKTFARMTPETISPKA
jgi:hypothetical protein